MIFVDRNTVAVPRVFHSDRARAETDRIEHLLMTVGKEIEQIRITFDYPIWNESRSAIRELFNNKCAYCESRIGEGAGADSIDHFRPLSQAADLKGNSDHLHYWWLAYEWRNLYLACNECCKNKRNLFPVKGKRSKLIQPYELVVRYEQPYLIDPCDSGTFPGQYLIFSEDGVVASEHRRGQITIDTLMLNRSGLVKSRKQTMDLFARSVNEWKRVESRAGMRRVAKMLSAEAPYAGMCRQFAVQMLDNLPSSSVLREKLSNLVSPFRKEYPHRTKNELKRARSLYEHHRSDLEKSTFEPTSPGASQAREWIYLEDVTIRRIIARNLRSIRHLDVQISHEGDPSELIEARREGQWTLLLGENATGKSTLLQALSLALIGSRYRDELNIDGRSFVRNRCKTGYLEVHFGEADDRLRITFSKDSRSIQVDGFGIDGPKHLLLAYGSTRLLPNASQTSNAGHISPAVRDYARVENLFNPYVSLGDANDWLLELARSRRSDSGRIRFNYVARVLKDLLQIPARAVLRPNLRRKRIEIPSLGVNSLEELSDGYQSIVALGADIMKVLHQYFTSMDDAKGVVLIDELGTHLHPRWKMRVVRSLRKAFPNVQFIVTTQDPLCLRGSEDGEVVVLRKDPQHGTFALTDLPPVAGMQVDQLLTSEHFGLSSTLDPIIEDKFQRYYELLRKKTLTRSEKNECNDLRSALAAIGIMGATHRETLLLEAIDLHLAKKQALRSDAERNEACQRLRDSLNRILERSRR